MTVLLSPTARSDRRNEQRSLSAAVRVLSPGETLRVAPGVWPGNVTFPRGANVVGSGRNNTTLPGRLNFPGGGNLQSLNLPITSTLIYGGGSGRLVNLFFDGSATFNGGDITGRNITSRTGRSTITIKPGGSVSVRISDSSLGPISLGGTSSISRSSIFAIGQGGGISRITDVTVGSTVNINRGRATMNNVTIRNSMVIEPGGAVIIPRRVIIG